MYLVVFLTEDGTLAWNVILKLVVNSLSCFFFFKLCNAKNERITAKDKMKETSFSINSPKRLRAPLHLIHISKKKVNFIDFIS